MMKLLIKLPSRLVREYRSDSSARTLLVGLTLFTVVISLSLAGCGGGAGGDSATAVVDATYIDAINGSDVNGDGSISNPFQTITYALSSGLSSNLLVLSKGIYDASSGESFPIVLPPKTSIATSTRGTDESSFAIVRGAGPHATVSAGTQPVAIAIENGGNLKSIVIEANSGTAIWDGTSKDEVVIVDCLLRNSRTGIVFETASNAELNRNEIRDNESSGIEINGESSPKLVENTIRGNGVGITVQGPATPNFRTASFTGLNVIQQNLACDLRHLGVSDIDVIGTVWDQDVFDFAATDSCATGANIAVEGVGAVDFQFIPSETTPLFPGTRSMSTLAPDFGEVIFTQSPDLAWGSTGSRLSAAAIWDVPPAATSEGILNPDRIIWFWHSGLPSGVAGFVKYTDGIKPSSDNLLSGSPPEPLATGRSYYWAAWEWNGAGENIVASTNVSYFRIAP